MDAEESRPGSDRGERERPPAAEFAHVLFLDLCGYSRASTEGQARMFEELGRVVRATPAFLRAFTAPDALIPVPSGDGMALAFLRDPLGPVECATEIARALVDHPRVRVRMGIHSGPISRVTDIAGKVNLIGNGINFAQRVMDCGDAGHILLSAAAAAVAGEFEAWAGSLTDLGEVEVKHGVRVRLFNLHLGEVGNPEVPGRVATDTRGAASGAPMAGGSVGAPLAAPPIPGAETRGGAVPLGSPFYVARPADEEFRRAVAGRDSIVLVKGARQMGKTSLLARGLQRAREAGAKVALTDFQALSAAHLEDAGTLYRALAEMLADQLDLDAAPGDDWRDDRGPNTNFERFLRRRVLESLSPTPLVWGLDEVDRLFPCAFGSEVFGLFRSWHNKRALDPSQPWGRLTLAMAYATEAHLFITDLNQSPFNVGTRLSLDDFTPEQLAELNARYGSPLDEEALRRLYARIGGQPYLCRCAFDALSASDAPLPQDDFEARAATDDGPFGDHLRRLLFSLTQDAALSAAARGLLDGRPCPSPESFYRLRAAGLVRGESADDCRLRCRLYEEYLSRHLPAGAG